MRRAVLALAVLALAGCQLRELVAPTPSPKCYVSLWSKRRDPVTGAVLDSAWLGTTEVACKDFP